MYAIINIVVKDCITLVPTGPARSNWPNMVLDHFWREYNILPRYGKKLGVVTSESPSSLLLRPPRRVDDLHDLMSQGAYDYDAPQLFAREPLLKTFMTIIGVS